MLINGQQADCVCFPVRSLLNRQKKVILLSCTVFSLFGAERGCSEMRKHTHRGGVGRVENERREIGRERTG